MKKYPNTLSGSDRKCLNCGHNWLSWFTTENFPKEKKGQDIYHCEECNYLFYWDDQKLEVCCDGRYMKSLHEAFEMSEILNKELVALLDKYSILDSVEKTEKNWLGKQVYTLPN